MTQHNATTITVHTIDEALSQLAAHEDDDCLIVDADGQELYPDYRGGVMYADGANAAYYGPLSEGGSA